MNTDKRKYPRYSVHFPVFFFEEDFSNHQPFGDGIASNLSEYGCKVSSSTKLENGDRLAVGLHFPHLGKKIHIHRVVVRWMNEKDFGLEFTSIRQGEQENLRKFLQTLESASEPQH